MPNITQSAISKKPALLYLVVFASALALYVFTCAPGALWQDSGMYQYRVWHNDIKGGLGLALAHPLYHIIAIGVKHIPLGEFAYRINLLSAVFGALTIANLALLLRLWLGKTAPAIIGAMTLALSHTFWAHSVIAETYILYTAILFGELLLLLQYERTQKIGYLYGLGLLNGLAVANHMLATIALTCYAVFLLVLLAKKHIAPKHLAIIIALWILGAAPYEYLVITTMIQTGDIAATLRSAAFGTHWQTAVLNTAISLKLAKDNLLLVMLNFPTPNILLFPLGLYALIKMPRPAGFKTVVFALMLLFLAFAFRYKIMDRYAFFIPFYCMASIFIGLGYNLLSEKARFKPLPLIIATLALLPIGAYAAAPTLAKKAGFTLSRNRVIPYRNDYVWFLKPWQTGYNGPEKFARQALAAVEPNAIIYADGTTAYPLLWAHEVAGLRPDVTILSEHGSVKNPHVYDEHTIDKVFDQHPLYVVSPVKNCCPRFLSCKYDFVKEGLLYRAVKKQH